MFRILAMVLLVSAPLGAQGITGFTPESSRAEIELENQLKSIPDAAVAQRHARFLADTPHVAGTPRQHVTAQYVLNAMASWGLDTSRTSYRVYLPFNDSTVVEVIGENRSRLDLTEPPVASDPTTLKEGWPAMNGYSGRGDVTAPVIYVNYGLPADYLELDSLGISVSGKVVMARYGRSFRGIKAREAELHGAVALMLFSDPMDDGFMRGEVYPEGPMRSPDGVQRGSLFLDQGDPSTPGWPSVDGAQRIPLDEMHVPGIPVVPMGYRNAGQFLSRMKGPSVPNGWQGGLGFRYHLGDQSLSARVAVWAERGDKAYKKIENTFGRIVGTEFPDQLVIVGGHRDAWSAGALDDVSGTISVLEAARAWGEAVKAGKRPRRTLVFATWDAEEWGLIGSSEWVEENAALLESSAVAYINQDVVASGRSFGAGGTNSLRGLMSDVAKTITQPGDSVSVFDGWARRTVSASQPEPSFGDLGGGSDFMGFYNHVGVPSLEFGFGGAGGSYHSNYDTWSFVEEFADPGYLSHRAAAQTLAVLMARLANADVVGFEYGDLGTYLVKLVDRTRREPLADSISTALDDLAAAGEVLAQVGARFSLARNGALSAGGTAESFGATNRLLREVERQLIKPAGLDGRPFLKNLIFASDRDNGYANVQYPAIVEALRDHNPTAAAAAASDLAQRIRRAGAILERARAALPQQ